MRNYFISLMVFIPILGALIQALLPKDQNRWISLISSIASGACGIIMVASMKGLTSEVQISETLPWVGSYAISYEMGIDGLNALLILLVALLFPILIASEWNQKIAPRGMHGLFLVLQTAFFGAICAQDLFLQFFFWALSALPFYFLIGIWGGEGRENAAMRSIVAASLGNALIFAALVLIYYSVDPHTFSLKELSGGKFAGRSLELMGFELSVPIVSFLLISLGLALRAPIWPFHGWFTHVSQETPFSVFVAICGAGVPVATYIFIRLCYSLFPETVLTFAPAIVVVGIINLLMGGICAAAQKGLRLLLAFVCLSETGLVLIGIGSLNPAGIVGAVYQQLVLGLALAGFGLFAGLISERAGHTSFLDVDGDRQFGGIATRAPWVAVVAGMVIASLLGFPGFGGFVGHSLLMIGSYSVHPATVLIAGVSFLLATYYLFTMYRAVFLGRTGAALQGFSDLTLREQAYLFPLVAALLLLGIYPKPLLDLVRPTVLTLLSTIK